ncbi:MAG: metallophosphoesterase [Tannerella sp.]|jgi:predicted MPP superfamily phosphohydrolase|nr:metallophosphoesterase [Tannerella sp.]
MVALFILMLCAYLGSNVYIFIRGLQALQHFPPVVRWIFGGIFWISVFSMILVFALRNSKLSATAWAHLFFEYSTGWLVFTLYMTLFLLCFDGFRLFNHPFQHSFVVSLGLTLGVLSCGFYRYRHPVIRTLNIGIDKPMTGAKDTFRIVAISDLHLGMGTAKGQLQQYIRMIQAQQPDLILIGGDLIDNSIVPAQQRHMEQELSQLNAPSGIYMTPGNHEYISGIADCMQYIARTPVRFLRDTVVTLPNGIQLVGRDDRTNHARQSLAQLIVGTNPDYPLIVLDHQPSELSQTVDAGADLLFCGHTHRGQVWPMTWLTDRLFELSHGYEQRGSTHLYVSSGLALWGPPFRIGSRSEMVVFNLFSTKHRP